MEHWRAPSPQGPIYQYASMREMDRFVRQLTAVGFTGLDIFDFNIRQVVEMFGSLPAYEAFLRERGIEKLVGVFHASRFSPTAGPHVPETHDFYFKRVEALMQQLADVAVENIVVMPLGAYPQVEPVSDEKIKHTADYWSRVGELTLRYGAKLSAHHEFWGGIRSLEEIEKFYEWSNPETVFFFCDAGQHVIAGVDPVALYERYHDRTSGFHFKDTHDVDTKEEYRSPADAELNASVKRWFWEMGTPQGLVDFPALFAAIERHGYDGWLGVEHDKANIDGGSYAEATAVSMWYVGNVLHGIEPPKAEAPGITWSYAINQWKSEHDGFTRREQHERAFKTISASGFTAVELRAGTGRWEPLGRRELVTHPGNYGSGDGFRSFLAECGIERVSSWFYDPALPFQEEDMRPRSASDSADRAAIVESTRGFASFLAELGGSRLVVRPVASAWRLDGSAEGALAAASACWNAVGAATRDHGVRTTLHVDCLSALRTAEAIAAFLAQTDPELVGLTIDTAELTIAGIDPLRLYEEHRDRVDHFHFKDVHEVDTLGERTQQHAEREFLGAGGSREIPRWFQELGTARGLVDFRALMDAIVRHGWTGTIVVESDQSPDPAGSVMANGSYVQRVLSRAGVRG
jgi:sugar phosphate isomerase/epimerase